MLRKENPILKAVRCWFICSLFVSLYFDCLLWIHLRGGMFTACDCFQYPVMAPSRLETSMFTSEPCLQEEAELPLNIHFLKQILEVAEGCKRHPKMFSHAVSERTWGTSFTFKKCIFWTTTVSSMFIKHFAAACESTLKWVCAF